MKQWKGKAAAMALAMWATAVLAQPASPGTAGTRPVQVLASAELGATELRAEDLQRMTMEEMTRRGDRMVEEMDRAVKDLLGRLTSAVQQNDFNRINCINQTLTVMKGLLRLSGQNAISLREAVASRDRAGAEHEFVKLHIAWNRILGLRDQGHVCGGPGGETLFLGRPIVERQFAENLPSADVSAGLEDLPLELAPPPSASPYY